MRVGIACAFREGLVLPPCGRVAPRPRGQGSACWAAPGRRRQLAAPYTPPPRSSIFFLSLSLSFLCPLSVISLPHLQVMVCWSKACKVVRHLTSSVSQSHPLGSHRNLPDTGSGHPPPSSQTFSYPSLSSCCFATQLLGTYIWLLCLSTQLAEI